MVTKTKIKETETFNVKTVDTPSDLVAVNDSQLGLFDYSNYSEDFKLKSYERKARIKANEQVATKAFYDIAQDVKAQHDEMNNYQEWLKWCDKELGYKSRMSEQFLQIAKELPQRVAVDKFPNSFRGLNALASALSKANEETKEEILTAVESKTEEKGKALTEKEIKEITARIKEEYEEKINQLTEDLKEAKQGELFFQKTLEKKQEDYNDLQDTYSQKVTEIQNYESTIKNQNKKIEELNSSISIKENELNSIAQEKDEIEQKQSKLEILIKKEADKIVKNELKLKKQLLSNQEAELKDKSGKLT